MTSPTSNFGIEGVIDNVLNLSVTDLMRMVSTSDLERTLFTQILELDNHLLSMEDYTEWHSHIDRWCDNLRNIVCTLTSVQMSVCKKRVNSSIDSCDDKLEIDG